MKSLNMRILLILIGLVGSVWLSFAADISHTPLISGPLLGSDRVPIGRPSDGHVDGRGTAATASIDQIKTFVQGQMSSSGTDGMSKAIYDPTGIAANVFDRANHTGTQAISTITGLQSALNSKSDTTHLHTGVYEPLIPTGTSLQYIRGDKTLSTLNAADIPTLNQNTTGTAGGLSGTPNITVGSINASSLNIPYDGVAQGILSAYGNATYYFSLLADTGLTTNPAITVKNDGLYFNGSALGGGTWGSITGTLSAQTDLQAALDAITAGGITISTGTPSTPGAAYLNDSTHVLTVASTTGYTQFTGSFTAWDTTPDAFAFTDETDIALSTAKTSNAVTVAGINYPSAISVTGDTGYGYSKNSAACTATSGTVVAGDTVAACVTSSGSNSTATTATITIGGVSDTYSVTTAASSGPYSYVGKELVPASPVTTATTGTYTCAAGNSLLISARNSGANGTISFSTTTTNSITSILSNQHGAETTASVAWIANCDGSTGTYTATFSEIYGQVIIAEYSGLSGKIVEDAKFCNSSSNMSTDCSVTSSVSTGLVFGFMANSNSGTWNSVDGFSSRENSNQVEIVDKISSTGSNTIPSTYSASSGNIVIAVAIK